MISLDMSTEGSEQHFLAALTGIISVYVLPCWIFGCALWGFAKTEAINGYTDD